MPERRRRPGGRGAPLWRAAGGVTAAARGGGDGRERAAGHEAGRFELVRLSRAWGIRALTAFAFSHENWSRPKVEVDFLMRLFERLIHDSVAEFLRYTFYCKLVASHFGRL